jgi:hypothetical protein
MVSKMCLQIPSYDPDALMSDARRWRELAVEAQSPAREKYMGFAEKCEDLVSRSMRTSALKDEPALGSKH